MDILPSCCINSSHADWARAPKEAGAADGANPAKDLRAPRDLPNRPSHPGRHPVIPRLSTNTSMFLCIIHGVAPHRASLVKAHGEAVASPVRDHMEVASLARDLMEVASPARDLTVDLTEVGNPARDHTEAENLARDLMAEEEDGADGENTDGRVMDTLNMATNRADFSSLLSSFNDSRIRLC